MNTSHVNHDPDGCLTGMLCSASDDSPDLNHPIEKLKVQLWDKEQELVLQASALKRLEVRYEEITNQKCELDKEIVELKRQLRNQDKRLDVASVEMQGLSEQLAEVTSKSNTQAVQVLEAVQQVEQFKQALELSTEDSELILLQLRQLQNELERYVVICREQSTALSIANASNLRAIGLILELTNFLEQG